MEQEEGGAMEQDGGSECRQLVVREPQVVVVQLDEAQDSGGITIHHILSAFRREADALVSAQAHLYDRQNINHEQVMALFQVYANAQGILEQNAEARLQSALADTRVQIESSTRALVEAASSRLKRDVEIGVNSALHNSLAVSFAPIESAVGERVKALAEVMNERLQVSVKPSFEEAKGAALARLQEQMVELLNRAESKLDDRATSVLITSTCMDQQQVMQQLKEYMEGAIQKQLEEAVRSQTDVLVVMAAADMTLRFEDQIGRAVDEVRALVADNEATALVRFNKHLEDLENRLLKYYRDELSALQTQQHADSATLTVSQKQVVAVSKMMAEFQQRLELRLKTSRRKALEQAEVAASGVVEQRCKELEASLQTLLEGKMAIAKTPAVERSDVPQDSEQSDLAAAVCGAIDRLTATLANTKAATALSSAITASTCVSESLHSTPCSAPAEPNTIAEVCQTTSTQTSATNNANTTEYSSAPTLLASERGSLVKLLVSDDVTAEIDKLLKEALSKAKEHVKANESIRSDLAKLQKDVANKAAADRDRRMQLLAPELLAKLRQLEHEMEEVWIHSC